MQTTVFRFFSKIWAILLLFFYITAIFFSKISAIFLRVLTVTLSALFVFVSVFYTLICLTSETLHYPWIPSLDVLLLAIFNTAHFSCVIVITHSNDSLFPGNQNTRDRFWPIACVDFEQ